MIVYGVYSKFYDNGKTEVYIKMYDMEYLPQNECLECLTFDGYVDYFTSKREAEKWLNDALNA